MTDYSLKNTFRAPGDVSITRVSLHRKSGDDGMNIVPFVLEINLFEDLFSPSMSGTLLISDSIGLSSRFPLIGGESVQIEFNTPEIPVEYGYIRKKFIIYKLESKVVINSKSIYVAHLISEFAYQDNKVRLSKKYSGNAVNIIHDLLKQELNVNFSYYNFWFPKTELSRNDVTFIAPNWSPITVINRIASLCVDIDTNLTDGDMAGYLFFESLNGFNFYSMSDLNYISEEEREVGIANSYFYDQNPNRTNEMRDYVAEMRQIQDLRVDLQFDMLTRMNTGIYKNQVIEFDIIKKTATALKPYDYMESIKEKMYKLNTYPISPEGSDFGDGKLTAHTSYNRAISEVDPSINPVKNRIALGLLNSVIIEIVVHGRTDLSVGDQIYLNMPSSVTPEKEDLTLPTDKLISGFYLITAIQHRLTEARHSMIIRMSTDSYSMKV